MEDLDPIKEKSDLKQKVSSLLPKGILVILIFLAGIWVGQNVALPFGGERAPIINLTNKNAPSEITVDFAPFWDVWDKITADYLERAKLDPKKLLYGAIFGLVEAVGDPYTVFLDPEENREFELALSGTYEGVGIELDVRDGKLVVVAPLEGTPAAKAGVRPADQILEIDQTDASTLTVQEAVKKIRGQEGTAVKLKIKREDSTFDVTLKRAKITIKSINFVDAGGGTAWIKVARFGGDGSNFTEWDEAVSKFTSGGYRKLILDLRNNPGGRLDYAIYMASDFVDKDTVIMFEEDARGKRIPFRSSRPPRLKSVKVVVLINKGSASASEIVAGALRDLTSAAIVGETSFGKGTVQKVDDLPDGSGLHITIAKWLTPKGTWVHQVGLKPDVEIKLSEEDFKEGRDPQLEHAKSLIK